MIGISSRIIIVPRSKPRLGSAAMAPLREASDRLQTLSRAGLTQERRAQLLAKSVAELDRSARGCFSSVGSRMRAFPPATRYARHRHRRAHARGAVAEQGPAGLIDGDGVVLDRVPVDKMPDLPLLIGPGANARRGSSTPDGRRADAQAAARFGDLGRRSPLGPQLPVWRDRRASGRRGGSQGASSNSPGSTKPPACSAVGSCASTCAFPAR